MNAKTIGIILATLTALYFINDYILISLDDFSWWSRIHDILHIGLPIFGLWASILLIKNNSKIN